MVEHDPTYPDRPRSICHLPRQRRTPTIPATLRRRKDVHGRRRHPREWSTVEHARRSTVHHWVTGADGTDIYTNRAVLFVNTRWGKIIAQEDYEDTERVAAYDRATGLLDTHS